MGGRYMDVDLQPIDCSIGQRKLFKQKKKKRNIHLTTLLTYRKASSKKLQKERKTIVRAAVR